MLFYLFLATFGLISFYHFSDQQLEEGFESNDRLFPRGLSEVIHIFIDVVGSTV